MPENSLQPPLIDVTGLSKKVSDASGELTILDDIHFTVRSGSTVALVGASGSGKSTLLGLLAGLDLPSSGKVLINGTDLYALDEDGRAALRKSQLGFVFQSFQLLSHLTALENVMLPLELRADPGARQKAEQMLGRVGLSQRLRHYPKFLSGGEQQRVALARAFVTDPPLLLADEPTGSLEVCGRSIRQQRAAHEQAAAFSGCLSPSSLAAGWRVARASGACAGRAGGDCAWHCARLRDSAHQ